MGEPIIYPRINEMLSGLHRKGISTFMVTNAQFPDEMESLVPVTQLYILPIFYPYLPHPYP